MIGDGSKSSGVLIWCWLSREFIIVCGRRCAEARRFTGMRTWRSSQTPLRCARKPMKHFDVYPESLKEKRLGKSLSEEPMIHDDCVIVDSNIGAWTEIGRGTMIIESSFGDYSYTAGDVDMIYTEVGKFCSIASYVRINPGNHPMQRVMQHHMTYRRKAFGFAETDDTEFFEWRRAHRCVIGTIPVCCS